MINNLSVWCNAIFKLFLGMTPTPNLFFQMAHIDELNGTISFQLLTEKMWLTVNDVG